jgi:hypothetical protein
VDRQLSIFAKESMFLLLKAHWKRFVIEYYFDF